MVIYTEFKSSNIIEIRKGLGVFLFVVNKILFDG